MAQTKIPTLKDDGPKTYREFLAKQKDSPVDVDLVSHIIQKKIPKDAEIELSLFQACNLRCSFCWQDHDDKEGLDSIRHKAVPIKEFLGTNPSPKTTICMMGGELFQDGQDPSLFDQYFDLCADVTEHAKTIGKQVRFTLVTNMIWRDRAPVEALLNRLVAAGVAVGFSTSLDFHGRPVKHDPKTQWYSNVTYFKEYIDTINMVLTRPAIKRFVEGDTAFFKQLYDEGFPLSFDYYTPETNAFLLVPSDKEILDILLKIAREFPNVSPMRQWIDQEYNSMTCMGPNKITILPSGRIVTCRQLKYDPKDFLNPVFYESNANLILQSLTKKECLTCPYFARCGFSCFVMEDHKYFASRQELPECLYKVMFREIDDGLNHKADRTV